MVRHAKPTDWEVLIRTMLPLPIRIEDGLLIRGDPGEVVRIAEDEIAVAAYAVIWEGQEPGLESALRG